jgi:hypothetical protein
MSVSMIRRALAGLAAASAVIAFAPAHAVGISTGVQILDPSGACASWTAGGTAAAPTLTCVPPTTSTPGAPAGCGLTATPSTITAAQNVTLSATCTSGTDSTTAWAWTGGSAVANPAPGVSSSQVVNVAATTTFTVVATNSVGPSSTKSATVTLSTGGGGGGGAGGAISCSGFNSTVVMNFPYVPGTQKQIDTNAMGVGFGNNDIVVATFTTPAVMTTGGKNFQIAVVHYPGPNATRTIALSTAPCDFSSSLVPGKSTAANDTPYLIGSATKSVGVVLLPNTKYYLNIKNLTTSGAPSCGSDDGNCPIQVTLISKS